MKIFKKFKFTEVVTNMPLSKAPATASANLHPTITIRPTKVDTGRFVYLYTIQMNYVIKIKGHTLFECSSESVYIADGISKDEMASVIRLVELEFASELSKMPLPFSYKITKIHASTILNAVDTLYKTLL